MSAIEAGQAPDGERVARRWIYRLDADFIGTLAFSVDGVYRCYNRTDYEAHGPRATVRLEIGAGTRVRIPKGYAWDGCSPKGVAFDIVFGTPDGAIDLATGRPITYYASLVHDALYQFAAEGAPWQRADADRTFDQILRACGFRLRPIYTAAVRVFGGIFTWLGRRVGDRSDIDFVCVRDDRVVFRGQGRRAKPRSSGSTNTPTHEF